MHEHPPDINHLEVMSDQSEINPPASLFEHYAETEFEIYGVRGTLRQLINDGGCPVPAHERSFAATERFTAKLVERAGMEVPDQFAYLRSVEQPKLDATVAAKKDTPSQRFDSKSTAQIAEKNDRFEASATVIAAEPKNADKVVENRLVMEALVLAGQQNEEQAIKTAPITVSEKKTKLPFASIQPKAELPTFDFIPKNEQQLSVIKIVERAHDRAAKTVADLPKDITNHPNTISEPVSEDLAQQYLGELYHAASQEVAVAKATDEAIAEILGLTLTNDSELDDYELAEISLPEPEVDDLLNKLSYEQFAVAESYTAEPKPIVELMPVTLTEAYDEAVKTLPTVETQPITDLLEKIVAIADRLQILVATERSESPEASQIEELLDNYYLQLHELLKLPIEADERRRFMVAVRQGAIQDQITDEFEHPNDEGTHEFKFAFLTQTHQLQTLLQQTTNLARFIVKLGVTQPSLQ